MRWYQVFQDGPEYEARKKAKFFKPPNITLKAVQDAVPKRLLERSTTKGLAYTTRHLLITYALYVFATRIPEFTAHAAEAYALGPNATSAVRASLWIFYWFWQSITFIGIWCLGHETGHDGLSQYRFINNLVGIVLHTSLLVPYFSWRRTHSNHHKTTNDMARDETYHPPTRSEMKLPDGKVAVEMDYSEILEETPAFTLFKMFIRQFWGWQLYLLHNRKGNPRYHGRFTSHYRPSSGLFKPTDRDSIIFSDICILIAFGLLGLWIHKTSFRHVSAMYFIPWLWCNNWVVTVTYLQHSDPTIPYYRGSEWTFARGALATVDRPFFGWIGRFFLHNLAHDHVAHHFFSTAPFYNLPEITEAIKPVLGPYYAYDTTSTFRALWRSFTECKFVEDDGQVLFFKDMKGKALIDIDPAIAN